MNNRDHLQMPGAIAARNPVCAGSAFRIIFSATLAASLLMATPGRVTWAANIGMPAGSTVWMELDSAACDNGLTTRGDCIGSNVLGPNPGGGIVESTFVDGGESATGQAEIHFDHMRSYISASHATTFMTLSMADTYTVHGTASDPFQITAHFSASGTASNSAWSCCAVYMLVAPQVTIKIGNFATATEPDFLEQFRVAPFSPSQEANWTPGTQSSPSATSYLIDLAISYSAMHSIGDTFDLAFLLRSSVGHGTIDLLDTGTLSFDLPAGVYLTSAQGGTFGVASVPLPATVWLLASGLLGLIGRVYRRRAAG